MQPGQLYAAKAIQFLYVQSFEIVPPEELVMLR